jgi:CPA2 family monovalent cation:H+ antiporter-2
LLFTHIAEIIIVATIVSAVLKKLHQPNLFAYIIAGIILGPLVIGSVDWASLGVPFELGIKAITPEIKLLSTLGAALLLFSIGIETSIHRLFKVGKPIFLATLVQVFGVIFAAIIITVPTGLLSFEQAVFVGTIIAFSSTMIVVKLLADSNEINTLTGRLMVSMLLLQDFMVIFFLPVLANLSNITNVWLIGTVIAKSIFLILFAYAMNRIVFPRLFKVAADEQELFLLSSIATAFVFMGLSELLGIPIPIGAFIGGLALSTLPYNLEIFSKIRVLRDFFLTIFFVVLGIQLDFVFKSVPLPLMIAIILLVFIIKPLIFFLVSLLAGYGSKMGVKLGLGLSQVSEFGFELAGIGALTLMASGQPIFSNDLFSFIVAVIAISMIITPYLMNSSSKVAQFFYLKTRVLPRSLRRDFFTRNIDELEKIPAKKELKDHIVIVGGGTVGRGLAKALMRNHQVIVIDRDPEVVAQGKKDNLPYAYGTFENEALWERLDLGDAKLLVLTILNHREAINMVKQAKLYCPKITIFAVAHYFSDTLDFYNNKVDFVAMPSIIGSNIFLENISTFIESGKLFNVQNFKNEYIDYLKEQAEEEKRYRQFGFFY